MDKETLSNYGWIVICILVLSVMIALATPFGRYIATAVENTTQGLFDVQQKAMDKAGLEMMQQEFEEMLNGPSETTSPLKFGQPYAMVQDGMTVEYVFYADGSATMWMADAYGGYIPAGTVTYTATEVIKGEDSVKISADGTYLYDPEDESLKMTVKSVSKGNVKTNTQYIADPNGLIGITGFDVQIGADGSITIYQNGVAGETVIASAITWYDNYFVIKEDGQEDLMGAIYPDGSKITIGGIVYVIGCEHENTTTQSKDATCTEDGYTNAVVCADCGRMISAGTTVSALGHSITNGICTACGYDATVSYTLTASGYKKKTGIDISSGDIVIPETFQATDGTWYKVISIGTFAFQGCTSLTSIDIPDSVTSIGDGAFQDCTSLKRINLPDGITTINRWTFAGCTSLTSINLPKNLTSIGTQAFQKCTSLTSIDIPDSVTSIDTFAFAGCTSLTSIDLPENLTSIGDYTFSGCTSLESIDLSRCTNLTSIGNSAFYGCTSLESIDLSRCTNLTSIFSIAFFNCTSLTSITLPESVTTIGSSAFRYCESLKSITFKGIIAQWNAIAFGDYWNEGVPATVVHCSDGDITL